MTGRERLEAVFAGEMVDRLPFALKGWRIPHGEAEERLLAEGMCVLDSRSVCRTESPNVTTETVRSEGRQGHQIETHIHTPKGSLRTVSRPVVEAQTERTSWQTEWPFKRPEDYAPIEYMIRDRQHMADYGPLLRAQVEAPDAAYFKTGAPGAPIHHVMYSLMGLEMFSVEWAERRDRVLGLCESMAQNQREIYTIVARSPAKVVQCGGNYAPDVLGRERFVDHVLPHWEEVGAILHQEGKLLGCHLDANNRLWAAEVGRSLLDWVEAFTPAPDTDMTLADARAAWPGKVLFLNFPSSVHLGSRDDIRETTLQLLRESAPGDRTVVGITENVPDDRWEESFSTILETLNACGSLPVDPSAL